MAPQPAPKRAQGRSAKQLRKWNRRLKLFFCCLGYKRNKDSIGDVASIFADFYADLNVPSSHLAAGFVLLSRHQAAQRRWLLSQPGAAVQRYLSGVAVSPESRFVDMAEARDSHLLNDLVHYMHYCLAVFGWPMQMVDDPCMLCCICPYLSCARHRKRAPPAASQQAGAPQTAPQSPESRSPTPPPWPGPQIVQDNCCSCHAASAKRRLAAHNFELLHASYRVDVNVVPYLVAADHSRRAVVVAIRGSMSLSDLVTDMNGQLDRLPVPGCPDDWLGHRGMTRAACYVRDALLGPQRLLEAAFAAKPELLSDEYSLVLCGHSLGAGVAAILGILLHRQYPRLRAYLYSPPGGILSLAAVEYTKLFATGVILGNDIVCRLGLAQLERLRYHVLLSLKSSERSPAAVLAGALWPSCCRKRRQAPQAAHYDPEQSIDLLHGTSARAFEYNGAKIPFQAQPQLLYVPGRLIHIVRNHHWLPAANQSGPSYQAVWTDNTSYDRLLIADGMFYDHLPTSLMHAMKMLFRNSVPARLAHAAAVGPLTGSCRAATTASECSSPAPATLTTLPEWPERATGSPQPSLDENNNNNNNNNNIEQVAVGDKLA